MDKISSTSLDLTNSNIEKFKELFPNVLTEGKIDFDKLKIILGEEVDDNKEKYQFTWPGKSNSIKIAQMPSTTTLRPDKLSSKDWENTKNLYLEGDNLEVLKQLQKTYYGKIKMIYIDPPYNTGNDFVYRDNFSNSIGNYIEQTEQGMSSNPQTNGRYHTDWLNMMYPRLLLAKNLLKDDGVIFISIDDNEMDNLRKVCDEIFGESNFIAHIIHKNNSMKNQSKYIGVSTEYILIYAKNMDSLNEKQGKWRANKKGAADINNLYIKLKEKGLTLLEIRENIMVMYSRPKYSHLSRWNKVDEKGVFKDADLSRNNGPKNYTIINPNTGKECVIPNRGWGKSYEELLRLQKEDLIWYGDENTPPGQKSYLTEDSESVFDNFIFADNSVDKKYLDKLFGAPVFEFPKPVEALKQLISLCTKENDIILDFFSGSASTADAVMKLNNEDGMNRQFVMVQIPEKCDANSVAFKAGYKTICEIGKKRIDKSGDLIKESNSLFSNNLDIGFKVFKLDSTNIKPWDNGIQMDSQSLFDLSDVFKEGRTKEDVLYEIMLKYGVFDMQASEIEINGKTMYRVGKRYMIVCLEDNVTSKDIEAIGELSPRTVIFKESGFNNDNDKINAVYNLEKAGVEDVKCI